MKAVVFDRYGPPTRLRIADVPTPEPRRGEVLVQVVATSVNMTDWESLQGSPAYARIPGLFRPRRQILGSDIAGRVVALGRDASTFHVGDAVYGDVLRVQGGFAEFAVARESELAIKPDGLSFAEASTIPQAGAIALQAVARARPGDRMLINGAGGGTGSFAIQLAKAAGIHVTAVDNASKLDYLRELGADRVIDYRSQDFTRTGPYDLVIDLIASRSVFAYRRSLGPGGRYYMVGGTSRTILRLLTAGGLVGLLTGTRLGMLFVTQGPSNFTPLVERILAGDIAVRIDSRHQLEDVPQALARHGEGRALGKVVIDVA